MWLCASAIGTRPWDHENELMAESPKKDTKSLLRMLASPDEEWKTQLSGRYVVEAGSASRRCLAPRPRVSQAAVHAPARLTAASTRWRWAAATWVDKKPPQGWYSCGDFWTPWACRSCHYFELFLKQPKSWLGPCFWPSSIPCFQYKQVSSVHGCGSLKTKMQG
jgi:hypothetical protein